MPRNFFRTLFFLAFVWVLHRYPVLQSLRIVDTILTANSLMDVMGKFLPNKGEAPSKEGASKERQGSGVNSVNILRFFRDILLMGIAMCSLIGLTLWIVAISVQKAKLSALL